MYYLRILPTQVQVIPLQVGFWGKPIAEGTGPESVQPLESQALLCAAQRGDHCQVL
jgi:hypothetical protein